MLDSIFYSEKIDALKSALEKRHKSLEPVEKIQGLDRRRKELIGAVENLKSKRNSLSQQVGQLKAQAKADPEKAKQAEIIIAETKTLGDEIKNLDTELSAVQDAFTQIAMAIPNMPHESVPAGDSAEQNFEVRRWGYVRTFDFKPLDHVVLGEQAKIIDFERAAKISGARFALYSGAGARLERALIQFMLDEHTQKNGYEEWIPPFLVSRHALEGTGNLPKFEEDLFKVTGGERELFLIPTAEVPLTNIYRDSILSFEELPKYFTAYSPCFRSEAGSYGKDVKGLIRQHQFQKVEMVKLCTPETSYDELEKMLGNAEGILQALGLPYRVMALCAGDMGFSAAKTYDLEVWVPSQNQYREISSVSNCEDFQARRAGIRFKADAAAKTRFVHTLNGSGLAVGRTFLAILENFQQADGSILIPPVLHSYVGSAPGFDRVEEDLFIRPRK